MVENVTKDARAPLAYPHRPFGNLIPEEPIWGGGCLLVAGKWRVVKPIGVKLHSSGAFEYCTAAGAAPPSSPAKCAEAGDGAGEERACRESTGSVSKGAPACPRGPSP